MRNRPSRIESQPILTALERCYLDDFANVVSLGENQVFWKCRMSRLMRSNLTAGGKSHMQVVNDELKAKPGI